MVDRGFWARRKVFLTGHTGFKGGWLATWLLEMGAEVTGYSLPPPTEPSYFALCGLGERMRSITGDVRDARALDQALREAGPSVVMHLAAQPLVRRSYREPVETFSTNVMGTVHLLEAVRGSLTVQAVVIVTSDKCYEDRQWPWGYREVDRIGGGDPYSASKGCAELVANAYRHSFLERVARPVGIATVRAGNVIGGGDWAEDRLVPDAIRALHQGRPITVRNPGSTRPWQHVLDPLAGYLSVAERLCDSATQWSGPWNFGPSELHRARVADLADLIVRSWGRGEWREAPDPNGPAESHGLALDSSKARMLLGWLPRLSLEGAVDMTVSWYERALSVKEETVPFDLSREQIRAYEAKRECR